jgi:hypothetical protein
MPLGAANTGAGGMSTTPMSTIPFVALLGMFFGAAILRITPRNEYN